MKRTIDAPPAAFRIPEKLYVEGFSPIVALSERFITTNPPAQKQKLLRARGAHRPHYKLHYKLTLQSTL